MKEHKGQFKKGNIPWNKGTKGLMNTWNKGMKGFCKKYSCGFKKGNKLYKLANHSNCGQKKGFKHTEEAKRNISISKKGKPSKKKGIKISFEQKIKISLALTGKKYFDGFSMNYNKRLRKSVDWVDWRKRVFERDNYTCQDCNIKGDYLHPHHIVPVAECLTLDYEKLIFDIDNGLTLCKDCHLGKDYHKGLSRKRGD